MSCTLGNLPDTCILLQVDSGYRCEICAGFEKPKATVAYDENSWYNSKPEEAPSTKPLDVDARVHGGLLTICEFAGHECDPDKRRRCKFFDSASVDKYRCMYYYEETGRCDCLGG